MSRGDWVEEVESMDPWGEGGRNSGLPPRPKEVRSEAPSGQGTPWRDSKSGGSQSGGSGNNTVEERKNVAEESGGSGNNTGARMGERKKVSFGDYVKNKNTSTPKATADRRLEVPKVTVSGNGVLAQT